MLTNNERLKKVDNDRRTTQHESQPISNLSDKVDFKSIKLSNKITKFAIEDVKFL